MEEPKNQPESEVIDEKLQEAEERAAALEAELQMGDVIGGGISPEALASMDPVQLQALLSQMQQAEKKPRSYYCRKQIPKAVKRRKRKLAKAARKVSLRNGGGRTISRRRRTRKAA